MANQAKVKIADIPEGQLFKWNRVVYKKSTKPTDETRAIDTRTGKEIIFYDGCKGVLITGEEEVFKNYGSEKWVIREALSYLLQKYWDEVVQKYPQIEKQIGVHCPINPVGAVTEFLKEETYCNVEYAEKSKMETLQAEGNEIGCEEHPKEIEEEKEL